MSDRILNQRTIFDYIEKYYPELKFWNGFDKHEPRNPNKPYKHRAGMPNEIRIEFDGDDRDKNWLNINQTAIKLFQAGYNFAIFSVEGGRSPHIHLYDHDELDNYPIELRNRYRELFVRKFTPSGSNPDMGLCDEKHLCALEFANHFKHKKPKELLYMFHQGALNNQGCDFDIIWKLLHPKEKKKKKGSKEKITVKDYTLTEVLKAKKRDFIISNLNFEKVFEEYGVKYKGKMALCPFHKDTDFSLSFSNEKGLWKCFGTGCEKKGDIITIIKFLKQQKKDGKGSNKK